MSRVNTILPYTRPEGASDEDAARARTLLRLAPAPTARRSAKGKWPTTENSSIPCRMADEGQQRFTPPARKKNLRNVEFL
ncbi:TPA: hypothetical protein ACH3X1_012297 [Trebouxia sp. C0004]